MVAGVPEVRVTQDGSEPPRVQLYGPLPPVALQLALSPPGNWIVPPVDVQFTDGTFTGTMVPLKVQGVLLVPKLSLAVTVKL